VIKHNRPFHEILVLLVLEAFAAFAFDAVIAIPLALIFLLLCSVLFTKLEWYRGAGNGAFVGFAHAIHGILLLCALFLDNAASLTIVLIASVAACFILFSAEAGIGQEKVVKYRAHAVTIVLTYMIFAYDIEVPIVASVLLMLLAIAAVGAGFLLRVKSVRIYGLVLSLFVCGKILLVDFGGTQTEDKVILFLVVGILALAISYLYMRIEKSLSGKQVPDVRQNETEP
jgi:hypothetical protein